jgi:hypothetical protein
MQNFVAKENYFLADQEQNLNALNTKYPSGNYIFTVISNTASQPVTVFPSSLQQPEPASRQ